MGSIYKERWSVWVSARSITKLSIVRLPSRSLGRIISSEAWLAAYYNVRPRRRYANSSRSAVLAVEARHWNPIKIKRKWQYEQKNSKVSHTAYSAICKKCVLCINVFFCKFTVPFWPSRTVHTMFKKIYCTFVLCSYEKYFFPCI